MKTNKLIIAMFITLIVNVMNAQETTAKMDSLPLNPKNNCYLRYYYFPNLEAYFDNLKMVYYYKEEGTWNEADELPENYGGYSIYNKGKVSIANFDGEKPYELLALHKKLYPYNSKGRFTYSTASTN